MADDPAQEARECRDELYRRIMRHADLTGRDFEQAAAECGLTQRQIQILKREHPALSYRRRNNW